VVAEPGAGPGAEAIAAARARWPHSAGSDLPLQVGWEGAQLVLSLPEATRLTWFPLAPALPQPEGLVEGGEAAGPRLAITYPEPLPAVSGVLVARVGDVTHHLAVDLKAAD